MEGHSSLQYDDEIMSIANINSDTTFTEDHEESEVVIISSPQEELICESFNYNADDENSIDSRNDFCPSLIRSSTPVHMNVCSLSSLDISILSTSQQSTGITQDNEYESSLESEGENYLNNIRASTPLVRVETSFLEKNIQINCEKQCCKPSDNNSMSESNKEPINDVIDFNHSTLSNSGNNMSSNNTLCETSRSECDGFKSIDLNCEVIDNSESNSVCNSFTEIYPSNTDCAPCDSDQQSCDNIRTHSQYVGGSLTAVGEENSFHGAWSNCDSRVNCNKPYMTMQLGGGHSHTTQTNNSSIEENNSVHSVENVSNVSVESISDDLSTHDNDIDSSKDEHNKKKHF